ncbi:MAG: hypothetical protein R2745_17700 [Vicinamibacterales bacterium]
MSRPSLGSTLSLAAALGLAVTAALAAQPREFADAHRANQAALRHYSWTSRTDLRVGGESTKVRLEYVRFDYDGRLQKTTIGGGTAADAARPGPPGPAGAVRTRVAARKKAAFRDRLADLATLAESYAHLPPDRLEAFAARSVLTPEDATTIRIQGRGLLEAGDQMTAWIDRERLAMRRVEITTIYDGNRVRIRADYRTTDTGLTYQARATLDYPADGIEVVVDTFDYLPAR